MFRYSENSGLRVLVGAGVFPGGAAGRGKKTPAITKESGQPFGPLSVSKTGGKFL
tara:strand:+ start:149 stop:313 length:165 start_codon:yes stop_codon:yes gene_type:complete